VGELIQPGQAVFWMSCCDALHITVDIDEEDIPSVKPGQKVLIRADAFPDRVLEDTVAEITPKGDPISRSFRVRIKIPVDTPVMIGMTVDCNIIVGERHDALLVPASAVNEGHVWLVRDGALARRAVKVDVSGERLVEIRDGLGENDLVVVRPDDGFREGRYARVRRTSGS
jgi:RND family efflux transporter MFP subunit